MEKTGNQRLEAKRKREYRAKKKADIGIGVDLMICGGQTIVLDHDNVAQALSVSP